MATRGQSNIIGFLLIIAISISLVATVYFWAWPNLQKAQNYDEVLRLENRFDELHSAIKRSANEQTTTATPFSIKKGTLWVDDNNSIRYEANLKLDLPFQDQTLFGNRTEFGILGRDEPAYLERAGSVKYRLHYTTLHNTDKTNENNYTIILLVNRTTKQVAAGPGDHTVIARWLKENRTYQVPFKTNTDGTVSATADTIAEFVEIEIV